MLFICIETMALKKKKTSKKNSSSSKITHREVLEEIIRVDHAGEYGATKIYDGQIAIFGKNSKLGKTIQHNFELIANLNKFTKFGFPIMIGPSRKSFIGKTLNLPIEDRIDGTSASVTAGIMNGARIVRVHDVKEIKRVVTIVDKIRTAK